MKKKVLRGAIYTNPIFIKFIHVNNVFNICVWTLEILIYVLVILRPEVHNFKLLFIDYCVTCIYNQKGQVFES